MAGRAERVVAPEREQPEGGAAAVPPGDGAAAVPHWLGWQGTAELPVAWRINAEQIVVLGWGAAILMQFAHPLVAAGVAVHSSVAGRPEMRLRRLQGTLDAMLALTFGAWDDVTRAAGGINKIHDRVHGRSAEPSPAFPAGTRYDAHDPELLRWVHATLLYALPRAYELFVGPLTRAEKDQFCLESAQVMPLLGLRVEDLPMTMTELRAYLDRMLASGAIAVGATARGLAHDLLSPAGLGPTLPLLPLVRLATVGLLPPALRDAYGLRWSRRHEAALRIAAAAGRGLLPLLPPLLRYFPVARRAMRRAGV